MFRILMLMVVLLYLASCYSYNYKDPEKYHDHWNRKIIIEDISKGKISLNREDTNGVEVADPAQEGGKREINSVTPPKKYNIDQKQKEPDFQSKLEEYIKDEKSKEQGG
jgi:hypothetical protein